MEKEWYRSKSIWAGIALILKGIFYDFLLVDNPPVAIETILIGLGLIGIRQAIG
jgi:hypothetical protein